MLTRRKLIFGVGSLTAGLVGITSTGAFTSAEADRSVSVQVTGDSDAFLALRQTTDPNSQAFVNTDGDTVSFDFSDSNETADLGNGFNIDTVTKLDNLLEAQNQGAQSFYLSVDLAGLGFIDEEGFNPYVGMAVKSEKTADSYENANIVFNSEVANSSGGEVPDPADDGPYELSTGERVYLDLIVDTSDVTTPISLDNGELTFIANQKSTLQTE